MGPGKGIERVIDAMGSLNDLPAGRAIWSQAERIRRFLLHRARHTATPGRTGAAARRGGFGRPSTPSYRDVALLTALIQSCAVVVLPYDSTDQVTSGVLVDAIASGRPVVATAFPHAVELLGQRGRASSSTTTTRTRWRPRCAGADGAPPGRCDGGRGRRLAPDRWPGRSSASAYWEAGASAAFAERPALV